MNGQPPNIDMTTKAMVSLLNNLQDATYDIADRHGFLEMEQQCPRELLFFATHMGLIHSEVSEALEYARIPDGFKKMSDKIPDFTAIEEEMADIIIRVLMISKKYGLRTPEAVLAKAVFNDTRPYRHSGKMF